MDKKQTKGGDNRCGRNDSAGLDRVGNPPATACDFPVASGRNDSAGLDVASVGPSEPEKVAYQRRGTAVDPGCDFPVASGRNDSAGLDVSDGLPLGDASQGTRETAALRAWVEGWQTATGQSQRAAAGVLGTDEKSLRRYLSGARPVPEKVLHALAMHPFQPPVPSDVPPRSPSFQEAPDAPL